MSKYFRLLVAVAGCLCVATAFAQTKSTGSQSCAKPDIQQMVPAGDHPDHSIGVVQLKCTWTKPFEIGTDKSKDGQNAETMEITGTSVRFNGFHVSNMLSGDKLFVSYKGTGTMKKGVAEGRKGTWAYTGGTGKLKGIKGKGTFTCAPAEGGGSTCEIEGEYKLAK
jgi:hypothetical protein